MTRDGDWSSCAVIAREWSYLDPVRTLCEMEGIPVQMANEDFSGVWHLRETQRMVNFVRGRESSLVNGSELSDWLGMQPANPWNELLREAIGEYELETGGAETPVGHFIEWLAEWARDVRGRQRGLLLLTAHRAKGLEFDHVVVLDGGWERADRGDDPDSSRRLYYVAMTRARKTLAVVRFAEGQNPFLGGLLDVPAVLERDGPVALPPAIPELSRRYRRVSLRGVFLSFAGYRRPGDRVHGAIASLSPGDLLGVRPGPTRWELLDHHGTVVGQLAGSFEGIPGMICAFARVLAVVSWDRERSEPEYRKGIRCDSWEVVVPELVFEPGPD